MTTQSGPVYNLVTRDGGVTWHETVGVDLPAAQDALITECPCAICQCPQLSEDGADCVACRNGFHDSDVE